MKIKQKFYAVMVEDNKNYKVTYSDFESKEAAYKMYKSIKSVNYLTMEKQKVELIEYTIIRSKGK